MTLTADELKKYLDVIRGADMMSVHLVTEGFTLSGTFGPPMSATTEAFPAAGGWKMDAQDPEDPDPLGIGSLDAAFPMDPVAPSEPESVE